ncbi:MAG TPA: HD domain-containing protein [Actinomycetota bacterium]|nr:HD domain-containing protein [Actinomycetota bacterium]
MALGGYGRRVLLPGSDVDLMVLHAEPEAKDAAEVAERLFYPFWDAGIPLGHAVRTLDACLEEARGRVDVASSLLDARPVAGDPALVRKLSTDLERELRAGGEFVDRLHDDAVDRHGRYPAVSMVLEPNLKEGSGGLRDVAMVRWVRRVDDAVRLSDRDAAVLDAAEEFLVRVRSALHLEAGKRTDRLSLEYQPSIAEAFGFEATVGLDAPDALMRTLFGHARDVEHVRDRIFRGPDATRDIAPPVSAEEVLDLFARMASTGDHPPADVVEAAERVVEATPVGPWTERMREAFIDLLAGPHAGRSLESMDRIGALHRLLPEWEPVRCRPQRNPYHRFPVDVHLIRTLEGVGRALQGEDEEPMVALAVGAVEDRRALLLGGLLHDIGKIGRPDHAAIGEKAAGAVLDRIGVGKPTRDDVLFLVRHHLLLANTAVRRDLTDENPILDVAGVVEDGRRLAMLYILTLADARATGGHAASPWRLALIREVVGKVQNVLDGGRGDGPPPTVIGERIEAIHRLLAREDASTVSRFLARLPRSYLLAVAPEVAADHFRLLATPVGRTEVRTVTGPGERPGTYDVAVVAADRPGLLARIAGSLSISALSILSAQAFTTDDGTAIDLFTVEPAFHGEVDEDRWRRFRTTLRRALEGRAWLEERVRERRAHERPPAAPVPTVVRVLDDASDFSTVVEVETTDRIGLLHDLARAFADLGLDVHLAKVATYGPRVVDAFYVRDLEGRKLGETGRVEEVERALLERLEAG